MNLQRLKEAEAAFLGRFPEGFDDPGLASIRRSHNVPRLAAFARNSIDRAVFSQPHRFADTLVAIVGRSSMVSRFEKPGFREAIRSLTSNDKARLANSFEKRLFGRRKREGFEEIVDFLAHYKLARWSLVSAVPFYFSPNNEVFVKPTTAKKIIALLDVDLRYDPRPDWTFYGGYRKLIGEIKAVVDPRLAPNNAAITGFLMATL